MMTPYDKLKPLADSERYLRPSVTFEILDKLAMRISGNELVTQLRTDRNKLFNLIFEQDRKQA
jgi:hypothetical protein